MRVFVDSDVVISSLISNKGAAHLLINETKAIECFVSDASIKELEQVADRLKLDRSKLAKTIKTRFHTVNLGNQPNPSGYTYDLNDEHIVNGAVAAEAKFLITYNAKHFDENKLKDSFNIIVLRPGAFLQYLRLIGKF